MVERILIGCEGSRWMVGRQLGWVDGWDDDDDDDDDDALIPLEEEGEQEQEARSRSVITRLAIRPTLDTHTVSKTRS